MGVESFPANLSVPELETAASQPQKRYASLNPLKISIITAVFNREATIGHAVESIAGQAHTDVEHVIVDGASSDNTLAEIERRRYSRPRVVSEPDSGIYDALNKGIANSSGEIIGLLHSDDYFANDQVLSKIDEAFTDPSIDAVYSDLHYVTASDDGRIVRNWRSGGYEYAKLRRGWMPPHPTLFLRRAVIEKFGAYDTSYEIAADYDAILRWFGKGRLRVTYIPEVLVKMRIGGVSNRSLRKIIRKSMEDYRAIRANEIGGLGTLALKNIRKLGQFIT